MYLFFRNNAAHAILLFMVLVLMIVGLFGWCIARCYILAAADVESYKCFQAYVYSMNDEPPKEPSPRIEKTTNQKYPGTTMRS